MFMNKFQKINKNEYHSYEIFGVEVFQLKLIN